MKNIYYSLTIKQKTLLVEVRDALKENGITMSLLTPATGDMSNALIEFEKSKASIKLMPVKG